MSTINYTAHGLVAGNRVAFENVEPTDTGLDEDMVYYVLTAGLTADAFQISEIAEGTPLTLAFNITSANMWVVPEVDSDDEVMDDVNEAAYEPLIEEEEAPTNFDGAMALTPPPAIPNGFVVQAGVLSFAASWVNTEGKNLKSYELRYAPDDGTGTGPDVTQYNVIKTRSTFLIVVVPTVDTNADGVADSKYWAQVRAVSRADEVDDGTGVRVSALDEDMPDAGYTPALSVSPRLTSEDDIGLYTITTDHIALAGLRADRIKTGDLNIQTADADMIDGIKVYLGTQLVGLWNEDGLIVYDNATNVDYAILTDGYLRFFQNNILTAEIGPAGVLADSIRTGSLAGGHNIIDNSSFELGAFSTATPVAVTFTDNSGTPGWKAANRTTAPVNVTEGGSLTQTGRTY